MRLHTDAVTPQMREVARALSTFLDISYYLAGGTALALRIGHRRSVDLDYFTPQAIDTTLLKSTLMEHVPEMSVTFEEKNTLWVDIKGVKVSFISRFEKLLDEVERVEEFPLASPRDITVMKLNALCGRDEYKDYFDIACLAKDSDIRSWIAWWEEVYPNQDFTSWVVALSAVDSVTPVPLDIFGEYKNLPVSKTILQVARDITEYAEKI